MDFSLVIPPDYYDGVAAPASWPDKVVFYTRTNRSRLDPGRKTFHHSRYNLVCSLHGDCGIALDGRSLMLAEDRMLLIHPWQTFQFVYEADKPLRWVFFGFDLALQGRPAADIPQRPSSGPPAPLLPRNEVRAFNPFFSQLLAAGIRRHFSSGSGPWLAPFLATLLAELPFLPAVPDILGLPEIHGEGGLQGRNLVARTQEFALDRPGEDLDCSELAARCGYSESRFRQLFSAAAGIPLGSYLRKVRLNEAARLLASSGDSVSAIAETCGFASLFAFSRCFKRYFGSAPTAFRRSAAFGGSAASERSAVPAGPSGL